MTQPTPSVALRALLDELETELKRIAKINTDEDRKRVVPELTMFMWLEKAQAALPPEGRHQEEVIATLREIWDRATAWRLNEDPKRLIDWIADVAEAALGKHETSQSYRCKALQSSDPNASECDWPECGCDPYALRVLEASQERQRKSSKDSRRTEP